ncbi:4130_t:CDS:2 [Funneliformis caledonium]|uniref:4130_t:CDS:1 n=1 Tax=Funneliformis caledonium TaxID=1117310 RepID=A0A9N8ZJN1_9GLOM|nr:4130_t:CDS:2 [Funneliformis caledonium]
MTAIFGMVGLEEINISGVRKVMSLKDVDISDVCICEVVSLKKVDVSGIHICEMVNLEKVNANFISFITTSLKDVIVYILS